MRGNLDEQQIERRVNWAYWIAAGIIAATAWCVKLQFQVAEMKGDMDQNQETAQHYRDLHNAHDIQEEHRFTALEADVSWLKNRRQQ